MRSKLTGWFTTLITLFAISLPSQATNHSNKIEVIEFFSYGCRYCYDLQPTIDKWSKKLPSDVVFKRIPVSFGRFQWASLAKLYYVLETTGDLARLDRAIFEALHEKGLKLYDDKSVVDWVTLRVNDSQKFAATFNSYGVAYRVKRGDQLAQILGIHAVPTLVIDGRYLVSRDGASDYTDMLERAEEIINKLRAERSISGQ